MKGATVAIGRIIGAHGIRGEVAFKPYGGYDDFTWDRVHVSAAGAVKDMTVEAARPHKGGYIILFAGVATRNDAERLAGAEVSIDRAELPDLSDGEYYQFELIGLDVVDETGKAVGKVRGFIQTGGAADVIEVAGPGGREVLIPFAEGSVIGVDREAGRITVTLPEEVDAQGAGRR